MTKVVFDRIMDGVQEALAWSRGEIALPVTDFSSGSPITTVRHRGAPVTVGDDNASQTKAPKSS